MIRTVVMRNWMCFRGEHVIHLGPRAHALVARYEGDPGRSNWGGKSAILEAIYFALTDRLHKDRRFDADGWITRGEKEGAASVVFDDGSAILRERSRGKPTQVWFGTPTSSGASQDEASAAVLKHLRLSPDDFLNAAYFEQRQMARLVLTEPEKRFAIVRGWLGLERAEVAEGLAEDEAGENAREVARLRARLAALEESTPRGEPDDEAALEKAIAEATDRIGKLVARAAEALEAERALRGRQADEALVAEYDAIVAEGKSVAERVAGQPADLEARRDAARALWEADYAKQVEAEAESRARHKVSLGQFSGRCPVADIECPATRRINDDRAAAKAALEKARGAEELARKQAEKSAKKKHEATQEVEHAQRWRERLEYLRDVAREKGPEAKAARKRLRAEPVRVDLACEEEHERAREERDELVGRRERARAAREGRERAEKEIAAATKDLELARRRASIATRGRAVLRAATRRVAERAIGEIEATTNRRLAEAGVDLRVDVRWEHEGKGPAKSCEQCGAAFPASAKVKACEGCGAARGRNVVQRLLFVPSDRSGAADDIVGVAFQLAAGAWLLRARESPWGCAILDEPLAACDRSNRRAVATQLVRLLADGGTWRQSLVISHSTDTVELFPARIEIVVGRDGSRRIVQS